ncbi:cobyrinic acid a,c-diamide synthase [Desulfomarina profundi]|uniref:Cobyrinate a,c-diamide synthase n=1 Tax=Desulfomarina profundi TaxID=2772557 RepID=A0A8D5JCV7_9BACT|nr:cobyrinate a,c-diamide synthase [Desulfomarina profundi]BCL60153.1 cobyrinic acid a,c-diamide synthase [Desulfomarina profundi]
MAERKDKRVRKGLVVAGLAGGSGKSVVSVGLSAALRRKGNNIVPFKKGPDYIDAGWLQLAAGNNCYNLDPYLMEPEKITESFLKRSVPADIVIVEGNRGLYDGVNVKGGYSTADLALTLGLPVLLVVNCTKTTRTVAAMLMGCMQFEPRLDICGVVLNRIGTERQKKLISEAVQYYTKLPVLGAIPRLKKDIFPMRHLGMVPWQEYEGSGKALDFLADLIEENVDLERISNLMAEVRGAGAVVRSEEKVPGDVRIGVLRDAAFQFYYSENLEALERCGAELVFFNAMTDSKLPPLDGLYIGGGFPETGARLLSENRGFCRSVKDAAESGMVIYAECGGLIYLGRSITIDGETFPMTDVFPVSFGMSPKPQAHGYTNFTVDGETVFYPRGLKVKGHEFRYSTILEWHGNDSDLVLKMERGKGFCNGRDGLAKKNVLALYTHVHAEGTVEWARGFVGRCRAVRRKQTD